MAHRKSVQLTTKVEEIKSAREQNGAKIALLTQVW